MALTRNMLKNLGIENDVIEEIIKAHSDTIMGLRDERDSYKNEADRISELENEISRLKKLNEDGEDWKKKYDNEKKSFENFKLKVEAEKENNAKADLYKQLLLDNGIEEKRVNAILKVTDVTKLEIGEDGQFVDSDKINDSIKNEWAGFIVAEKVKGAKVDNPPAKNTDTTKEDFEKMSLAEKMAFANENPEKYAQMA